ncbi:hypothetical protein Leryth_011057 [Lithospermum erythrorhizon]|nr:hypothetical protein Leryth_011057 [Lithospermum erythrorhizon]
MGRFSRTSVAAISGYSSNSTAGSSFRELDDAFLQKQTRIWLGEVLNTRLDELVDISDLLADGELLCEVSEVLWNSLLTKCAELWHLKANLKGPTASRKRGGRYMPYSNVDSFLKICKIFGLNGIDLFSPSDVVEKKNIRKVCICIRALSKKVRSKQLHLPDFDKVTYTVAMPTDMVECLRKSLESPQSSIASSSTYNSQEQSRSKLKQVKKLLVTRDVKNNDVSYEESDEAESTCRGTDSRYSSIDKLEAAAVLNSDLENTPGAYFSTRLQKNVAGERPSRHDYENQKVLFRSLDPSVNHSRDDNVADNMSFFHENSSTSLNDGVSLENGDTLRARNNSTLDVDLPLQNEYLAPDKVYYSSEERDYISEYLAFSDSVVLGTDCASPILSDGEGSTYNFFMGIDAHGSNLKRRDFDSGSQRRDSDVEDEVSSTTSMSSILGRVLAMEFDDKFDLDDISTMKDHPETFQDNKADEYLANGTTGSCKTEGIDESGTVTGFSCDAKGHILEMDSENLNHNVLPSTVEPGYIQKQSYSHRGQEKDLYSNDTEHADEGNKKSISSEDTGSIGSDTIGSEFNYSQHAIVQDLANVRLENLRCSTNKISVDDTKNCRQLYQEDEVTGQIESHGESLVKKMSPKNVRHDNIGIYPDGSVSPREVYQSSAKPVETACSTDHKKCQCVEKDADLSEFTNQDRQQPVVDDVSERRGDTNNEHSHIKPHRKLFNRVAKGTAIVGVLFFLLQLSKRVGDDNGKLRKKSRPTQKYSHSNSTKQDGNQGSKVTGTYPAEKFKL